MATIIKTLLIDAPADAVWDVVADFGAVHRRFAPGFVTDVELIPGARLVTFANGVVAKELFVGADPGARRLAYAICSERFVHHNASFAVEDLGEQGCKLTWTADVLPDEAAPAMSGMMDAGLAVAGPTLSRLAA